MTAPDRRYEHATCACGQTFQLIDWRCASHSLYHQGEIPDPPRFTNEEREALAAQADALNRAFFGKRGAK